MTKPKTTDPLGGDPLSPDDEGQGVVDGARVPVVVAHVAVDVPSSITFFPVCLNL